MTEITKTRKHRSGDVQGSGHLAALLVSPTFLVLARSAFGEDVSGLPAEAEAALAEPLGLDTASLEHFVYLGSGWTYGLAQEAALKIREAAQAWAESYPLLDYRHGPLAVAASKGMVRDSWTWPDAEIMSRQTAYIGHVFTSEDAREGARAFAEKRKPNWQGQ